MTANTRRSNAKVDRRVNTSELMQRRDKEQSKGVDRLEPKGNEVGTRAV